MTNTYFFGEYNPTSIIYEGNMTLTSDKMTLKIKGTITNSFDYRYHIKFFGEFEITKDKYYLLLTGELLGRYTLYAEDYSGEVYIDKIRGNYLYGGILKELTYVDQELEKLTFSVVNLIPVGDEVKKVNENKLYRGISTLVFENWVIKLEKHEDYKEIYEDLSTYRGYAHTHYGKISLKNGDLFSFKDAEKILNYFYSYLIFISGRRIYPSEFKGYKDGSLVFSRYENKNIDTWNILNTWHPKNIASLFPTLFENFVYFWDRKPWNKSKNILLGTYNECFSQVTLENRITSIQIALELISKLYLVDDTKVISNRKFKNNNMSASLKIKCLFEKLEIDLTIPSNYLKRNNAVETDPIKFLVEVRNSIVHAKKKIDLSTDNIFKSYSVGIWMLEICLLKLLNYNGRYNNRLTANKWHGEMESGGSYYKVPWIED